ncbi:protein zinc induced facilitator-LIKE 1 [Favolaschia claudopus]|uniref:Protein zinc induced facilitator-LIKE 1 n=1 Tax=Favolaschia claudopus TaxID=2862362 RepID=A0AAW0E8G9_9AGAR
MAEAPNPLPKLQVAISILIQAAEALSATVIFPFVPEFVRETGITGGDERKTGYWAGVLESIFFVAEFCSVFTWGRASDRFGRRPILLLGPLGLAFSLLGFGWSKTFVSLVFWRTLQGICNGNIGVVKTVVAELADSTNLAQVSSFISLGWSTGSTLGPIIGGLLANPEERWPNSFGKLQILRDNPYLLPCAAVAFMCLGISLLGLVGLKETSPMAIARQKRKERRLAAATDPSLTSGLLADEPVSYGAIPGTEVASDTNNVEPEDYTDEEPPTVRELLVPRLVIPLVNYGFFCFLQTAYQVLFPLMYSTSIPNGGLGFDPFWIGVTRGVYGVANSITVIFLAWRLIRKFGARTVYIFSFAQLFICIAAYPILNFFARRAGRVDGVVWAIVVMQLTSNIALSIAYSAIQIFIVNSTPRPSAMSSTNSIAQMVSTISRSLAPLFASSLFAVSLEMNLAGGYMVYIVLLGTVVAGMFSSFLLVHDPQKQTAE